MKKLFTLSFLLLAGCAAYFLTTKNKAASPTENNRSGAYEALSFFAEARTYPIGQLPEGAFFDAWQVAQRMEEAAVAERSVDPWETMGPHNRGGRTLTLAFNPQNPNTLFAGSASGGLWRSYSAGVGLNAWERIETGWPILGVSTIAFMPGDSTQLFIGTGEVYNVNAAGTGAADRSTRGSYGIGILKSEDGGETWASSLDFSYDQNKGIWDIEIAPTNPDIMYAGTTDGVYKSTDSGNNWSLVHDVVMANDVVVHPENENLLVVGCGNFASPGFGIYRSEDGGNSWVKINAGLPTYFEGKIQLDFAPSDPNILYASIGNGFSQANGASWLCRSDNFGTSWTIQSQVDYSKWQGWFSHDVAVNPNDPNDLTVIGIEVWKSFDGGQTLEQKSVGGVGFANPPIEGPDGNPDYVHSDAHDVIFHPTLPGVFYVANDGGVHRSLDNGNSYRSCNGRYQTTQFYNGFSNSAQNPNICMGGLQDNGTIQWNGASEGVTWTRVNGGDGSWSAINQQNDDFRYVSSQYLNVRRTQNGINYSSIFIDNVFPIAFIAPYLVAPSDGNILYAGTSRISKSFNRGANWTVTNNGNPLDGNPVLSMSMSSQNTDVVYVATAPYLSNPGSVFVTLNGGNTWNNVNGDLPDRYPMDLQVDPTDDAIAYVGYSGYGTGHIFQTTDYGTTWKDISGNLPNLPVNAIEVDPLFPNNIYVGNDIGVFVSTDYGETWETYQDGLTDAVMVFDLKISPANRKLRAATHGLGAFQRDLLEEPLVGTKLADRAILEVDLFPNPTSDRATIKYQLDRAEQVAVELLDNRGQLVRTELAAQQPAGRQTVDLLVDELPPAIYYVRIKVGGQLAVKRLVVQ